MTACPSVEGKWGEPCPACGAVLPRKPPPLRSWKAERAVELIGTAIGSGHTGRVWTDAQIVACRARAGQRYAGSKAMRVRP